VHGCSHACGVHRVSSKVVSVYGVSMYTVITQTWNINIEVFSLQLRATSREKRFYQYNKFTTISYQYFDDLQEVLYYIYSTVLVSS